MSERNRERYIGICELMDLLKDELKTTWYIHAFNEEKLYVVLSGKWFEIALHKDE